jgi:4a-hydroxytetrahydrobiopterin dehydratase
MPMKATFAAWKEDPQGLHQGFLFADFEHALAFVAAVGRLAQAADHHPDIDLRFNRVALSLFTHDAGRVTEKDRALAQAIDLITPGELVHGISQIFG